MQTYNTTNQNNFWLFTLLLDGILNTFDFLIFYLTYYMIRFNHFMMLFNGVPTFFITIFYLIDLYNRLERVLKIVPNKKWDHIKFGLLSVIILLMAFTLPLRKI